MTVQELREAITQKTEEINGYLESRDADKAEERTQRIYSTLLKITARLYRLRMIYRKTKLLISYRKLLSRTSRKLG